MLIIYYYDYYLLLGLLFIILLIIIIFFYNFFIIFVVMLYFSNFYKYIFQIRHFFFIQPSLYHSMIWKSSNKIEAFELIHSAYSIALTSFGTKFIVSVIFIDF